VATRNCERALRCHQCFCFFFFFFFFFFYPFFFFVGILGLTGWAPMRKHGPDSLSRYFAEASGNSNSTNRSNGYVQARSKLLVDQTPGSAWVVQRMPRQMIDNFATKLLQTHSACVSAVRDVPTTQRFTSLISGRSAQALNRDKVFTQPVAIRHRKRRLKTFDIGSGLTGFRGAKA